MSVKHLVLLAVVSVIVDCKEGNLASLISEGDDGLGWVPSANLVKDESAHGLDPDTETVDKIFRILSTNELSKKEEKGQKESLYYSGNETQSNSSKSESGREQTVTSHSKDKNKYNPGISDSRQKHLEKNEREQSPGHDEDNSPQKNHKSDSIIKIKINKKPSSDKKSNKLDQLTHSVLIEDLVNYTKKVMAERDFDLLVNTDIFLTIFKTDYEALAEVVEDNNDPVKYIKSAIENFYLEFNKIYHNLVSHSQNKEDEHLYKKAYHLALYVFGERRNFNAVKMAAPVRRIADLIKSIIGGPVEMIKTSCKEGMPKWQCNIAYLSKLIAAAESCPNIWSHSLVLETILQYNRVQNLSVVEDPIITALGSSKVRRGTSQPGWTQTHDNFEIILDVLADTMESAKKKLLLRADLYSLILELQNSGKLNCTDLGTPLYVF